MIVAIVTIGRPPQPGYQTKSYHGRGRLVATRCRVHACPRGSQLRRSWSRLLPRRIPLEDGKSALLPVVIVPVSAGTNRTGPHHQLPTPTGRPGLGGDARAPRVERKSWKRWGSPQIRGSATDVPAGSSVASQAAKAASLAAIARPTLRSTASPCPDFVGKGRPRVLCDGCRPRARPRSGHRRSDRALWSWSLDSIHGVDGHARLVSAVRTVTAGMTSRVRGGDALRRPHRDTPTPLRCTAPPQNDATLTVLRVCGRVRRTHSPQRLMTRSRIGYIEIPTRPRLDVVASEVSGQ